VEVTGEGVRAAVAVYANALRVDVQRNFGQLKVTHSDSRRPLPRVYVKVGVQLPHVAMRAVCIRGFTLFCDSTVLLEACGPPLFMHTRGVCVFHPAHARMWPLVAPLQVFSRTGSGVTRFYKDGLHRLARPLRLRVSQVRLQAGPHALRGSVVLLFSVTAKHSYIMFSVVCSTDELSSVERFALLVMSSEYGALVKETSPPLR
jgi:hypothetical protein